MEYRDKKSRKLKTPRRLPWIGVASLVFLTGVFAFGLKIGPRLALLPIRTDDKIARQEVRIPSESATKGAVPHQQVPIVRITERPVSQPTDFRQVEATKVSNEERVSQNESAQPEPHPGRTAAQVGSAKSDSVPEYEEATPEGKVATSEETRQEPAPQPDNQLGTTNTLERPRAATEAKRNSYATSQVYRVEVGRHDDKTDAEMLAKDLRNRGYKATVTVVSTSGGKKYRVQVGQYKTPEDARELAKDLSAIGYAATVFSEAPSD